MDICAEKFTLNQITCLVGKNESGKTVLLRAIEKLNALNESETVYNKTQDYPRRFLTDYKERHGGSEARVTWTAWRLEQPEIDALKTEFGPDCLGEEDEITVTKFYEQTGTSWTIPTKTAQIVEYLARNAGIVDDELKKVKPHLHSEVAFIDFFNGLEGEKPQSYTALQAKLASYPGYPDGCISSKASGLATASTGVRRAWASAMRSWPLAQQRRWLCSSSRRTRRPSYDVRRSSRHVAAQADLRRTASEGRPNESWGGVSDGQAIAC